MCGAIQGACFFLCVWGGGAARRGAAPSRRGRAATAPPLTWVLPAVAGAGSSSTLRTTWLRLQTARPCPRAASLHVRPLPPPAC